MAIVCGDRGQSPGESSLLQTPFQKQLRVFLHKIIPNPDCNPLDLISGLCHSGCKGLFLNSLIHWKEVEGETVPYCPMCIKLNLRRSLELMYFFQLRVLDPDGSLFDVVLTREHAHYFFDCGEREFLLNSAVRSSRLELLTDYLIDSCKKHKNIAPIMDITVALVKNTLFVINTRLKPTTL